MFLLLSLLGMRKKLLSRLSQELLHFGLAGDRIVLVYRKLGDGNVDPNTTTCVTTCYKLTFKL